MVKLEKYGEIMTLNQKFLNQKGEKEVKILIDFLFEGNHCDGSNRVKNDCALSSFQIFPSNIISLFFEARSRLHFIFEAIHNINYRIVVFL